MARSTHNSTTQPGAARCTGFAVIDTETTGLGHDDRVIEIGIVLLDPDLALDGEWATLVNPERSVGPVWVHHIHDSHVQHAPTFDEIAPEFLAQIRGRVVVAHNYAFDRRMLDGDLLRAEQPTLPDGLCTMRMSGNRSLANACIEYGITQHDHHHALADAHAAAAVFRHLWSSAEPEHRTRTLAQCSVVDVEVITAPSRVHTRADAAAV